ncbi:helix-turn-helix transcriptional regulator [Mycobacterium saskatchewanense]|nr:helix-turn-helix transcriptional regulator [Mycobacterium saskatchewanense]
MSALSQGRGNVLVVEGPPGIGKSRLTAELMVLASNLGIRTLFGEAFEYQRNVPFFSLLSAVLRADPPVGDSEALRRLNASADLRYWVVQDLQAAIGSAASNHPLAIVLEDIHWADHATLLALRSLAVADADAPPVLWVFTARNGAGGPALRETLRVLKRHGATFLRLTAVPPSGVTEIVQDVVKARAEDSLLSLADKAHGNPFLLKELLHGLDEEGRVDINDGRASARGDTLPRRLSIGMQQRLDGLSEAAREVVQIASVLPDRFSVALLAAMLQRPPAALVSPIGEAVHTDLLTDDGDHLRFRHDLLRDATRQSLPQSLRRAIERQSATVLLEMGAAPEEVVTQLTRSAEVGDHAAIGALRQAACSVAHSDPSAAADLSKRALELWPARDRGRGRDALIAETVELLNRATRYREAEELAGNTLAADPTPEEEAKIRLHLAVVTNENPQRRVEHNRRALELPRITDATRARHESWLAYNVAMSGRHDQARVALSEAAAAAAATGDPESHVLCEITSAYLDCAAGYATRAITRLEQLDSLHRGSDTTVAHMLADIHRVNLLAVMGRLEDASAIVSAGVDNARRERNGLALHAWSATNGLVHLVRGRLSEALAITEPLPAPEHAGATELGMLRMLILTHVAVHTDNRMLLHQAVIDAHAIHATGTGAVRDGAAAVLALAGWHRGDVHDSARWLHGHPNIFVTPTALFHLLLTARVAVVTGDDGLRAQALEQVELLERERPGVPIFTAVAQHSRGVLGRDPDELVAAADALRSCERPLLYASAAEDAGEALQGVERTFEALAHLNAAFDAYSDHEASADARRVGRALRRLGVHRRAAGRPRAKTGWESLTGSELKVVRLIAAGATNRSVAEQLHLSLHTVRSHRRNAFAKLGINSATQLTQLMRSSG